MRVEGSNEVDGEGRVAKQVVEMLGSLGLGKGRRIVEDLPEVLFREREQLRQLREGHGDGMMGVDGKESVLDFGEAAGSSWATVAASLKLLGGAAYPAPSESPGRGRWSTKSVCLPKPAGPNHHRRVANMG